MRGLNWETLPGRTVAGRYELQDLGHATETSAEFFTPGGSVRLAVPGNMLAPAESLALGHPHLRPISDTGFDETLNVEYAFSEGQANSLAEFLRGGPCSQRDAEQITAEIVSALGYLHERDLVYLNLAADSVVHSYGRWMLGWPELSRWAAAADPEVTRLMLTRASYIPPEAFSGNISPAWDIWSLGTLLKRMLLPRPERSPAGTPPRGMARPPLPEPFERIVRGALVPDPADRMLLREIAALLPPVAAYEPVVAAVRPQRVRSYDREEASASTPVDPPSGRRRIRLYDAGADPSAAPPVPDSAPLEVPALEESIRTDPAERYAHDLSRSHGARAVYVDTSEPEQSTAARRLHNAGRAVRTGAWALAGLFLGAMLYTYIPKSSGDETASTRERSVDSRPVSPAKPEPVPAAAQRPTPAPADRRAMIPQALEAWASSVRSLDAAANMTAYAPRVERYFGRRNVTRAEIGRDKERLFRDIHSVRKFQISDVRIESYSPERAVVSFRKDWDFAGTHSFAGAERSRMTLVWNGAKWQIATERETTVYWSRKGSRTAG